MHDKYYMLQPGMGGVERDSVSDTYVRYSLSSFFLLLSLSINLYVRPSVQFFGKMIFLVAIPSGNMIFFL